MLVQGNAAHLPLKSKIVQCVVTSPPYWGLRDYGLPPLVWGGTATCEHVWGAEGRSGQRQRNGADGGIHDGHQTNKLAENIILHPPTGSFCDRCGAWRGQLGLEPDPSLYVDHLVAVFRDVWRVLRDDGSVWLNLGDTYCNTDKWGGGGPNTGKHRRAPNGDVPSWVAVRRRWANVPGLKPKDLIGVPWRVAFALQADGWYLRSDIIWEKANAMPESVTDRPTVSHEHVFLLTKSATYYYDAQAIAEPSAYPGDARHLRTDRRKEEDPMCVDGGSRARTDSPTATTRNRRTVWTLPTSPYAGAHFATMPPALIELCLLAGTSLAGQCAMCGRPWQRQIERLKHPTRDVEGQRAAARGRTGRDDGHVPGPEGMVDDVRTIGWAPGCGCAAGEPVPQLVLDPFMGSGTTAKVALEHGRRVVGCDLSAPYLALQHERTAIIQPMLPFR